MVEVIRKKRKGIRIEHNRGLFWTIIILLILLIVLIWAVVRGGDEKKTYYFLKDNECIKVREYPKIITFSHYETLDDCEMLIIRECFSDSNCVKDECCHASSCVVKGDAPSCNDIFCTMECAPGTLDCGQGSCKCVRGKCEAVFSG